MGVLPEHYKAQGIEVYAPSGFFEHSVSENVLAGNLMSRRASYMYGNLIPPGAKGAVDGGLGKTTSTGTPAIVEPTITIYRDTPDSKVMPVSSHDYANTVVNKKKLSDLHRRHTIDGILMKFVMANGSEAPSEFMFYIPRYSTLMAAEVLTNTVHNISSLRGAKTRDASAWAKYIDTALMRFGADVNTMVASHHWPTWGNIKVVKQLEKSRDTYKFIHDQTLRLANKGLTPTEISKEIRLPKSLGMKWYNRGYYGTISHNVRATYDFYFGAWWDGNPANLNPMTPTEEGIAYVKAFGAQSIVDQALVEFNNGNYRWVVRVLNHVIFAYNRNLRMDLQNGISRQQYDQARFLSADAMEQMGYQAESGPWRNYYLGAARELRELVLPRVPTVDTQGISSNMTMGMKFDALSVQVNPDKAAELRTAALDMIITDQNEPAANMGTDYSLLLSNSVLKHYEGGSVPGMTFVAPKHAYSVVGTEDQMNKMLGFIATGNCDEIKLSNFEPGFTLNYKGLRDFCSVFEQPNAIFGIATP